MPHGQYIAAGFMYLNLGCHMMFVLKNRLKAQGIPVDKAVKIIGDLIDAIFKPHLVKAVIAVQEPMSITTLKDIFRKLAHSSIMKLDNSSMEKLIFLIIMTIKKEFFLTSSPVEIYSITLGNLQTLQQYVKQTDSASILQSIIDLFKESTSKHRFMEYQQLRDYVLSALQPLQTKVVNFVESGQQNEKGKLVFSQRNSHNTQPIGTGLSALTKSKNKTIYLPLKDWKEWKTSLVMDHAKEYQKQSERRNTKNESQSVGKDKSLSDLFGLSNENLTDFEVRLQFFGYEQKQTKSSIHSSKAPSTNVQKKVESKPQANKLKKRIDDEFKEVSDDLNEQMDLLDMMDN